MFEPKNINLYAYAHQNPLKLIDPDGRKTARPPPSARSVEPFRRGVPRAPERLGLPDPGSHGKGVQFLTNPGSTVSFAEVQAAQADADGVCLAPNQPGAALQQTTRNRHTPRVRHHTSREGLKGIKNDMEIWPARGEPAGVDVEMEPFGPPGQSAKDELGAVSGQAYVEFDQPENIVPYKGGSGGLGYIGPRNSGRIMTGGPDNNLSIEDKNPKFVKPLSGMFSQ